MTIEKKWSYFFDTNNERVKACALFVINYSLLLVAYSTFLTVTHYSTDTYNNYVNSVANVDINIRHGRFISAGVYKLLELLNFDYGQHVLAGELIFLAVFALGITLLIDRFFTISHNQSVSLLISLNTILLVLALNMSIMENLLFPDTLYSSSFCYMFCFLAVLFWCKSNRRWWDYLLSLFFLCLNLDMYQVCIGFYIIICLSYTFIDNKFCSWKKILSQTCLNLMIGILASLQSLFCMKLPQILGISSSEYVSELTVESILENTRQILSTQKNLWFGFCGFLPQYAPILFFVSTLILFGICLWRQRISPSICLLCVIGFAGSWFMSFAPYFIAEDVWMPPRTLFSLFALLALPGLWTVALAKEKKVHLLVNIIYGVFLVVMAVMIQKISINNFAVAKIDQEFCGIILHRLEEYESLTGEIVDTISICNDGSMRYGYDSIEFTIYDTNIRSFSTSWSDVAAIEYYSNRDFKRVKMAEEDYERMFGDASWNYFDAEDQIKFDGETMYLVVY